MDRRPRHRQLNWSTDVAQADWLIERLHPSIDGTAASIIPTGFAAYVRLLHPLDDERGPVRWRDVAAWSGRSLLPGADFYEVSIPDGLDGPPWPFDVFDPPISNLPLDQANCLAQYLRATTADPDDCWFGVWEGLGWESTVSLMLRWGRWRSSKVPNPIPRRIWGGPRAQLPGRDQILYRGRIEDLTAPTALGHSRGAANLAWPADRSWCVASDVDLPWTYVAGSDRLIAGLLAASDLEALESSPDEPTSRTTPWVTALGRQLADQLQSGPDTFLETRRGTLHFSVSHNVVSMRGVYPGGEGEASNGSSFDPTEQDGPHSLADAITDLIMRFGNGY